MASVTVEECEEDDADCESGASGTANDEVEEDDTDRVSASSVAAETEDSGTERLRQAQERARARAGRLSRLERAALLVSSYAVWRQVRKARRRAAAESDRFRFRVVKRPQGTEREAQAATEGLLGKERLQEPAVVEEPPAVEPETRGEGGAVPVDLPESMAWWREERSRQAAEPFRAGRVTTARLRWQRDTRPTPPAGHMLAWGPRTRTSRMAPDERDAFLKMLAKDVRSQALVPVAWDDIDVITPLLLVKHPVTGKWRLVHDARALNARLVASTVRLPRPADALLGLSWGAKLDIAQAFRHVAVHPDDRRVMGVVVDGIPFQWRALSFGVSHSPELFANALETTLRAVRKELPVGTAIVVYVDDILIVGRDQRALDAAVVRLLRALRGGGWQVALEKCYLRAARALPFLGLITDLEAGKLRVSRAKAERLEQLCAAAIRARRVTLRDLQRVGGLLAFFSAAAPEAGFARVGINAATAEAERLPGRTVSVKGRLLIDLEFWRRSAAHLPSMAPPAEGTGEVVTICTDHSGLPTLAWGGMIWEAGEAPPDIDGAIDAARAAVGRADADAGDTRRWKWLPAGSDFGGGLAVAGRTEMEFASDSSAALEVLALRRVLQALRHRLGKDCLRGRTVRWLCDAQVAVGAVGKWRTRADGLSRQLLNLLTEIRAMGCSVRPEWVAREAGWQPVADALSKMRWQRSTAEWKMTDGDRAQVLHQLGGFVPTVDLFASAGNATCAAFVSRWPETGAAWCDAFSHAWHGVRAWAFPPFSVAAAALRHAARARDMEGVFVVPQDTAVPARVRVLSTVDLPPMQFVDADDHLPPGCLPRALMALRITTRSVDGPS